MGACPLTLKCPSCKRGKWRYPLPVLGVRPTGRIEVTPHKGKRQRMRHRGEVKCLDCGHVWWSTHPSSGAMSPWELRTQREP